MTAGIDTYCAWCGADLSGVYIEGPSTSDFDSGTSRYCSARCLRALIDDQFTRRKRYGEKWVRYCVEVPPEISATLDTAIKQQLGINVGSFSRAGVTRRALIEFLQSILNVPEPAITADADDVADVVELPSATALPPANA